MNPCNRRALATLLLPIGAALAWPAAAQQSVSFAGLDGTTLTALWFAPAAVDKPSANTAKDANAASATDTPARAPVVVAMHGCGGLYASAGARKGKLSARHQAMGEMLAQQGYHVVFPDSLTPRGVASICAVRASQRTITQRERRSDALSALAWVRSQPWAAGDKVALLGWSHGGSAVLAASDANAPQVQAQNAGAPWRTLIAFYPGCGEAQRASYMPVAPLTLLLGADDDWTPSASCVSLAQHLMQPATKNPFAVNFTLYPGAVHGFDNPVPGMTERADVPSRLHPGEGVKLGQNLAAYQDSWQRVRTILREAFR